MAITLYVHGSLPPKPIMNLQFAETFFYCPDGLSLAKDLDPTYRVAKIAHILNNADSQQFPLDSFYLFGWSGLLAPEHRRNAADKLYHEICSLQKQYPHEPIRIITHSHGGNVVLNMAHLTDQKATSIQPIQQIILLACPVQKNTAHYTKSSIFQDILSFHSTLDMLQIMDPQGLYTLRGLIKEEGFYQTFTYLKQMWPLFSQRHFPDSDVKHVRVRYRNRGLTHIEFLLSDFLRHLPDILKYLKHNASAVSHTFNDIMITVEKHPTTNSTP